ncbi:hypothetical protein HDU67_003292 [Dinochytrium kinnereticum]|nr:hypothetical protein HDU67_003292 [Dinochytrium kinnereticum]
MSSSGWSEVPSSTKKKAAATPSSPGKAKGIAEVSSFAVLSEVNDRPKRAPSSATNSPKTAKKAGLTATNAVPVSVTASAAIVPQEVATPVKKEKKEAPVAHYNTTKLAEINLADLNVFLDNLKAKKSSVPVKELCDYLEQRIQALEVYTIPYASSKYQQPHLDWEERTDLPYGLYRAVTMKLKSAVVKFLKSLDNVQLADGLVAIVRGFVEGQKKAITVSSTHCRQTLAHEILIQIISVNWPNLFFCDKTSRGITPAHEVLGHYRTLIPAHPAVGHSLLWVCGQQILSALNPHLIGFEYWIEYFAPLFWNADDNVSASVQAASIDYLEAILSSMEAIQTKRILLDCTVPIISLENYLRLIDLIISPSSPLLRKKKKGDVIHLRLQRTYSVVRAMAFSIDRVEVLAFKEPTVDVFAFFLQAQKRAVDSETRAEIEGICTMLLARDLSSKSPQISQYWLSAYETYTSESLGVFRRILSLSAKKGKIWTKIVKSKEFSKMLSKFTTVLAPHAAKSKGGDFPALLGIVKTLHSHAKRYAAMFTASIFFYITFFLLIFVYYCMTYVACKDSKKGFCEAVDIFNVNVNFIFEFYGSYLPHAKNLVMEFFQPYMVILGPFVKPALGPTISFLISFWESKNTQDLVLILLKGKDQALALWHIAAEWAVFVMANEFCSWINEQIALIRCGKPFTPEENSETACEFHAQGPLFHEGSKGWACCSKRVLEFNDFLKIPGCTVGRHRVEVVAEAAPKPKAAEAPRSVVNGTEVYGREAVKKPEVAAAVPKAEVKPEVKEEDLNDPENATIAVGTSCKRPGCKHTYSEGVSKTEECVFHSGTPIFHEGSKGWTCCPRKVLEFDEFLKLTGCKKGKHRFIDQRLMVIQKEEVSTVQCRHDWYQTPTTVIVSIFAKKADKEKTVVTFNPQELVADIKFQDGKQFPFRTPLSLAIVPEECKYTILGTKIEIVLKKANGLSWPSLEPQENVVAWTTFGVNGGVGTVGSKQAIVAQDAPLHLLQKKQ